MEIDHSTELRHVPKATYGPRLIRLYLDLAFFDTVRLRVLRPPATPSRCFVICLLLSDCATSVFLSVHTSLLCWGHYSLSSVCLSVYLLSLLPAYLHHTRLQSSLFFLVFSILNIKNMLTYNLFLFRCVFSLAVFTLNAKPPHDHPPPSLPDRSAGPAACTPAAHASPTAPELTG